MACVELRPTFQPDNIADQKSPEQHTKELALIQAAAGRAKLLGQQLGEFTAAERQTIKRGEWALKQLLTAHQRIIQKLVSVYLTHQSEFADFEQEAILAFLSAVATYEPTRGSKLSTWAYVQIRNRLQDLRGDQVNHARATTKIRQNKQDLTSCELLQDQGFIRTSIQSLTRKQQEVVRLHLDGFDWVDIAQTLQTTVDAVRMLWTRAIQRVRRLLLGEKPVKEQQPEVIESQPAQETNNFGKPLLRRIFQHFSQSLRCFPSLQPSSSAAVSSSNPQLLPASISGVSHGFPGLTQRQGHCLVVMHRAQSRFFLNLKHAVNWRFWAVPPCAKGVRGSPRQVSIHAFRAKQPLA